MSYKNNVSVRVCGKTMTLSGNESVEYITRVANYIEDKANELRKSDNTKTLTPNLVSVLTSINIADDLFKERDKNEKLMQELDMLRSGVRIETDTETKLNEKDEEVERLLKEVEAKAIIEEENKHILETLKVETSAEIRKKDEEIETLLEEVGRLKASLEEKVTTTANDINTEFPEGVVKKDEEIETLKTKVETLLLEATTIKDELFVATEEKIFLVENVGTLESKVATLEEELKEKIAKINHLKSSENKRAFPGKTRNK